jgi:hypothetical protein
VVKSEERKYTQEIVPEFFRTDSYIFIKRNIYHNIPEGYMRKVTVGIVGVGGMANQKHRRQFRRTEILKLSHSAILIRQKLLQQRKNSVRRMPVSIPIIRSWLRKRRSRLFMYSLPINPTPLFPLLL